MRFYTEGEIIWSLFRDGLKWQINQSCVPIRGSRGNRPPLDQFWIDILKKIQWRFRTSVSLWPDRPLNLTLEVYTFSMWQSRKRWAVTPFTPSLMNTQWKVRSAPKFVSMAEYKLPSKYIVLRQSNKYFFHMFLIWRTSSCRHDHVNSNSRAPT